MSFIENSKMASLRQIDEKRISFSGKVNDSANKAPTEGNESQNEIFKQSKLPKKNFNSSEDSIMLISIFEKAIDYMSEDIEKVEDILNEFEDEEQLSIIRRKLQGPHKCIKCRKSKLVSRTSCGHLYCEKCTGELISNSQSCLDCSEPFPFKFKIISSIKSLQIDSAQPSILCLNCEKAPIESIIEGECNHMCMSCISQCYLNHIDECPICFNPLFQTSGYFNYNLRCQSCNKCKSYLTDYFGAIKKCHSMCGWCLGQSLESQSCNICKKRLNSMQMIDILRQISDQCSKCQQIVSRKNMTREKGNLCVSCNSE